MLWAICALSSVSWGGKEALLGIAKSSFFRTSLTVRSAVDLKSRNRVPSPDPQTLPASSEGSVRSNISIVLVYRVKFYMQMRIFPSVLKKDR